MSASIGRSRLPAATTVVDLAASGPRFTRAAHPSTVLPLPAVSRRLAVASGRTTARFVAPPQRRRKAPRRHRALGARTGGHPVTTADSLPGDTGATLDKIHRGARAH